MDIDTDDDVLRALSNGQEIDYELWPGLLSRLIPRLEKIVRTEFSLPSVPHPHIPPSGPPQSSPPPPSQIAETASQASTTSTQSTNKENAPPPSVDGPPGSLPPQIQYLLNSISSTLTSLFPKHPPHTIQRLAELVLFPKQHYRTLPAYLHAVDRVVHVTSGANIFPLPPAIPDPSSSTVLSNGAGVDPLSISWGNRSATTVPAAAGLGSDESLGGALLTPITWLGNKSSAGTRSPLEGEVKTESTEVIDGPNGPGGVETVSVSVNGIPSTRTDGVVTSPGESGAASLRMEGGVTQGELLRQEQRAGVVPVSQLEGSGNRGDADGMGEEDETPHARGPEEIGMEDMGPQGPGGSANQRTGAGVAMQGIDIEAAVGRKVDKEDEEGDGEKEKEEDGEKEGELPGTPKREAEEDLAAAGKRLKTDGGADTEVADAAEHESSNTEGAVAEAKESTGDAEATSA